MEKIVIKEILSKEYKKGRVDFFLIDGKRDIHQELSNLMMDLGFSEEKIEEFDIVTSGNEGFFFSYENEMRISLFLSEKEIFFVLDKKISKEKIIKEVEKYFQIF